ncbi:MAG: DUF2680 domain-containing protein [Sporomusaceae bacterium]|nr:DUF2680 domain-containing protein [Sporomusaceae bacterium]
MKKLTTYAFVGLFVLGIAGAAFAAAPTDQPGPGPGNFMCPFFTHRDTLTDEQKQAFTSFHQKMIENRKELIQQQVGWGWITQAQADAEVQRLDSWSKQGFDPSAMGPGMMGPGHHGGMRGPGMGGHGMMDGANCAPVAPPASNQ